MESDEFRLEDVVATTSVELKLEETLFKLDDEGGRALLNGIVLLFNT